MLNYDPLANSNTNTWCVPKVYGCMMPSISNPASLSAVTDGRQNSRDGLALNYNPAATVNDVTACGYEKLGCTDPLASNYDSKATIFFQCYYAPTFGCLDNEFLNYGCSDYACSVNPPNQNTYGPTGGVTNHRADLCNNKEPAPPPPPPSPSIPPLNPGAIFEVVTNA